MTPIPPIPEDLQALADKVFPLEECKRDKYAGACWNALMEEETKESIAEMFMDGMAERRELKERIAKLTAANEELERQNTRLKAPVSDEERKVFDTEYYSDAYESGLEAGIAAMNYIVASRAAIKEGQ